jgi:hypothetical protein
LREDLARFLTNHASDLSVNNLPHYRHGNPEYNRNYKKYYDEEMKEMVEAKYAKDIEMFGYQFDKLK